MSLAFPFLKQSQNTSITVLTNSAGERPDPSNSIMSIGAAMVKSMIQCASLEGAYHNIRVNGVAAGVTNTRARMNEDIKPEVPKLTLQEKI